MQNYYWPPPNPYQGPQAPPQSPVMFIPMPMGPNGKMPKPKNILKQMKEFQEFQKMLKGDEKKEEKKKEEDKKPSISMSPITALMWLLALSIPVGAAQFFLVYMPIMGMVAKAIK